MEVVNNNFLPGDPRLIQQLVYELKSQGIFDQFRKECIADVDTKPAYQNLRQRVEGSVTSFLKQQTWRPDMNKNQLREQLRKNIYESGYLETGVERIVDQVVNPKINTVFLPQVEDVVYRYLGIEKPNRSEVKKELKIDVADLLPTDLEAVSPESDHTDKKEEEINLNDSLNTDSKLEEDESPPFEPLEVEQSFVQHEENSVDSHLSGFSGLQSHDSNLGNETKIELSNQDSQVSHNSSESHLSIITSEENTKMEVCEDSESKIIKFSDSESKPEIPTTSYTNSDQSSFQKEIEAKKVSKVEQNKKDDKKSEQKNYEEKKIVEKKNDEKKLDEKKYEDKKYEKKGDDKKSKSSDKHGPKDKKDDKHRKNSSSSTSSKDKPKLSSKHSSSSKDKERSKDKKDTKSSSSSSKDKDKYEKEKSDRDKSKSSSTNSSRHSSSSSSSKDKDKSSSSKKEPSSRDKESYNKDKDKEKTRSSSSSASKDSKSKSNYSESKSKSSADKHKKNDKESHNGRPASSSSGKRDKEKKRDPKKDSKDDHYSAKDKKNHRRSTDRDSNDGQSNRQGHSTSFTGSTSSHSQKSNHESINLNGGSGDSGNSDQIEQSSVKSPTKLSESIENKEVISNTDIQKFKYIKPKFASNFEEARKLMKIRKQLAKLEKQNQLSLVQIEVPVELPIINGINCEETDHMDEVDKVDNLNKEPKTPERKQIVSVSNEGTPILQSTDLSKESWEALEARLAQEMSNVNYNSYESPYDDYDCSGYNAIVISPRKNKVTDANQMQKIEEKMEKIEDCSNQNEMVNDKIKLPIEIEDKVVDYPKEIIKLDIKNNVVDENKLEFESKDMEETKENEDEQNKSLVVYGIEKLAECTEIEQSNNSCVAKVTFDKRITKDLQIILRNEHPLKSVPNTDEQCRYLEKPSPSFEKHLQFIYRHVRKLEQDIERLLKMPKNNFSPVKRGRKRKLEENVDLKNNNKAHFEQTTESKKRRRSVAPNPNSLIAKANKEKVCNSTDVSPNDSFSLPLSPAESDKSIDKKEEDSPQLAKQKRNVISKNTSRCQRYSSDDLYKPRPLITSTRRRGAKNPGN